MMDIRTAYNFWSRQYDTNENKTRDLERIALRAVLQDKLFECCLEIGCGTGKNTIWLTSISKRVLAVDFSENMLAIAKGKIHSNNVTFLQADITGEWQFGSNTQFDLATFSLVLEHIKNLDHVFNELKGVMKPGGFVYIGELHPFKQYAGAKAKFETESGLTVLTCYQHNISDFITSAAKFCHKDRRNNNNSPKTYTSPFKPPLFPKPITTSLKYCIK